MKTYSTKASDINPTWHVFDATDQTLGRLASKVAQVLRGKHKPIYAPHLNIGDYVIVINSAKVKVTGNKTKQKTYYRHSGYPGGLKTISLEKLLQTRPNRVIEHAVRGMLSHNPLGRAMFRRLKVYAGDNHPHQAQIIHSEKIAAPTARVEQG
ncbi:MAG: ribosomal protein [Dehalococcoidia bacterium]|nr:ribosomal protein [Dehalococcoidia bacterium]